MMGYPTRIVIGVSKERISKLVGEGGTVIKEIEKATGTKITINKKTGQVIIDVKEDRVSDPIKARDIIRAIDLGFSPEEASRLKSPDTYLDVVDLRDYFGHSKGHLVRVKGRIIGAGGKTRRLISEFTGADIHIGSHYIAIIGTFEEIQGARKAVEMLINGAPHATVYRFLERFRAERKRREVLGGGLIG